MKESAQPASGTTIVLFAQPTDIAVASFTPTPLSRTTTDANGRWAAAVPAGTDLSPYADKTTGKINFSVKSFDAAGTSAYFLSAETAPSLAAAQSKYPDAVASGAATVGGASMVLATDPTASSDATLEPTQTNAPPAAGVTPQDNPVKCVDTRLSTDDNVKTLIGATFDEAQNTAVHFTSTAGSSSSLGIGISGTNAFGSFNSGGTESRSSSVTASFPATHNVQYWNYYGYASFSHFRVHCTGPHTDTTDYEYRPIGWDGGYTYSATSDFAMGVCTPVGALLTVTQDTTRAYMAAHGVNSSTLIGINLSSQTGYSMETKIDFAMGPHGHPWCGLSGFPGRVDSTPRLVTVHPGNL